MKKVVCVAVVSFALAGCQQEEMSQRELLEYCGYDEQSVDALEKERSVDFRVTGKACNTEIVYVEDDLDQETMTLDSDTTTAMLASGAAGLMLGHMIRGADAIDDLDDMMERKKYNRLSSTKKVQPKSISTSSKATAATGKSRTATPTKKKRSLLGAITSGAKRITNKVKTSGSSYQSKTKSSYSSSSRSRSYSSRRR